MFCSARGVKITVYLFPLESRSEFIRHLRDNSQRHCFTWLNLGCITFCPQMDDDLFDIRQRLFPRGICHPGIIRPRIQFLLPCICSHICICNIRAVAHNLPLTDSLPLGHIKPQICLFLRNACTRPGTHCYQVFYIVPRHHMPAVDLFLRRFNRTVIQIICKFVCISGTRHFHTEIPYQVTQTRGRRLRCAAQFAERTMVRVNRCKCCPQVLRN